MFSNIRQKKSFKGSLGRHLHFAEVRDLPQDTQWSHTPNAPLSPPGTGVAPLQGPAPYGEVSLQACTEGIQQTFNTHF